uniref:SAMM50 sorting and assembly machinery component n=1 Tax=Myripristis murdjan TaxID=586833 RepID=A0A667XQC9_9TELE
MGTVHARSLDPLPMHGPELGVHADDIDTPEIEQDSKQEVLENKDVMKKSHEARQKLLRLGIFRKVEVVIDTSQGTVNHVISDTARHRVFVNKHVLLIFFVKLITEIALLIFDHL